MKRKVILCTVFLVQVISLCQCRNFPNETIHQTNENGVWSQLLEDYTLSKSKSSRTARAWDDPINVHPNPNSLNGMSSQMNMNAPQTPNYQNRYIRPQGFYITKRIGEAMELEPHMRPPAKVINPPFRQNFGSQQIHSTGGGHPMQGNPQQHLSSPQQLREVSETDLYLLGAIEKLVYRVDYLESRVRRSEQMIYYLMAGNNQNQKEVKDSCPMNFTRIGDNCYHLNGDKQVNWKTANSACKSMGAYLTEFEKVAENEELIAYLLNHQGHRGKDFWLGGLNPGLLWIWSNSAKPVNPNTNLTSIAHTAQATNSTLKENTNETETEPKDQIDETNKILNNTIEIKGNGRCLRLSYNPAKHSYFYYGQECTSRHHYICEFEDKSLDNKIKKLSRDLNLNF